MIFHKTFLILGLLSLSLGSPNLAFADYEKGVAAYKQGDYQTALKEWLIDANLGDARAQHNLGVMYRVGRGVSENDEEAVRWYRLAAEQGYADAQLHLGLMYYKGEGVPRSNEEAVRLYHLAAGQGLADAQLHLGTMYYTGIMGVPENYIISYMWFDLAADKETIIFTRNFSSEAKNSLRELMTSEQIAEAQRLSAEWLEKHQ
ncbi:MAG: sel1 repeat family protein [Proteobacteria bacterium]|nr:sel1 repeat family protein [Pseudomonadota bacterium]